VTEHEDRQTIEPRSIRELVAYLSRFPWLDCHSPSPTFREFCGLMLCVAASGNGWLTLKAARDGRKRPLCLAYHDEHRECGLEFDPWGFTVEIDDQQLFCRYVTERDHTGGTAAPE